MGITEILAIVVVSLALIVGVVVGRRRGPLTGLAMGLGVLAAGCLAYVGLVAATWSM